MLAAVLKLGMLFGEADRAWSITIYLEKGRKNFASTLEKECAILKRRGIWCRLPVVDFVRGT